MPSSNPPSPPKFSSESLPPAPATVTKLAHNLLRVLAPNPSPMTYWGTNSYIIGQREVAIIDPGPDDAAHLERLRAAVPEGGEIRHIFVTHAHLDHSPGARTLAEATGAPVYAFGSANAGRSAVMSDLAEVGLTGGGEGVDQAFVPDICLADGAAVETEEWRLEALHTPGHMGNHLCFALDDALFCGDLVMGWASSLVSPPDGDLTDFMASCARLQAREWRVFYPGHGLEIDAPADRLDWLLTHRRAREGQILEALATGPATPADLATRIYTDTPRALLPAATRNVFAHLIDLHVRSLVHAHPNLAPNATFTALNEDPQKSPQKYDKCL